MTNRQRIRALVLTALALGIGTAAFVGVGSALHFQTPKFMTIAIPPQSSGTVGKSAAWTAEYWAFESSGDIIGTGNAVQQIFFYHHALRVLGGGFGITQLTCGPGGASNPAMAQKARLIAFEADGMLCSDPRHNCDRFATPTANRQIFVYRPETGQISQVTNCPADCTNPDITGNGKLIAFQTTALLTNGGGIGPVPEIYQADLRRLGENCRQVPCSTIPGISGVVRLTFGGGTLASQSFNGKKIAFESRGDLANGGVNPGTQQIYVMDVPGFLAGRPGTLRQVTFGADRNAYSPSLNMSGTLVAYAQEQPFGIEARMVKQIMLAKLARRPSTPARYTQVTNGGFDSFDPSLDPTGRRLAFTSLGDLLGLGVPGEQVYVFNIRRNILEQVTAGPTGSGKPEMSASTMMAFASADDFVGSGVVAPNVYIGNVFRGAPLTYKSPFEGTPTPLPTPTPSITATPSAILPKHIGLSLVSDNAAPNGNTTVTTVIAATVSDAFGVAVANGTPVRFTVLSPLDGAVVTDGQTNTDPDCDVSAFEDATGTQVLRQTGVAHVCLHYPGGVAGTVQRIRAEAGPRICDGGSAPGALCQIDAQCPAIGRCSSSFATTCVHAGQCPLGDTCDVHTATCEPSAVAEGDITLPLLVNDCQIAGAPCSDHNPCTVGDTCVGGTQDKACVGGANQGQTCTSDLQCPDLKACVGGTNQGAVCTTNANCPGGTCQVASPGACVLSNPPTCQSGTMVTCPDDGNLCTNDVCNVLTGACGAPKNCADDHNPCTDDVCDPLTGTCGVLNTAPCDDRNPCTVTDTCAAGVCAGTAMVCPDDLNRCTIDVCNPLNGQCGIRFDPCACSEPIAPTPVATATPDGTATPEPPTPTPTP